MFYIPFAIGFGYKLTGAIYVIDFICVTIYCIDIFIEMKSSKLSDIGTVLHDP
jgi:hypothetical protein